MLMKIPVVLGDQKFDLFSTTQSRLFVSKVIRRSAKDIESILFSFITYTPSFYLGLDVMNCTLKKLTFSHVPLELCKTEENDARKDYQDLEQ